MLVINHTVPCPLSWHHVIYSQVLASITYIMSAREGVVTDHVTSHRGGMFSPRWECSHRGGNTSHRGGNVLTAVGMFSPRWECSHHGGNVSTAVGMFPPR